MASFLPLLLLLNSSTLNINQDRLTFAGKYVQQLMTNLGGYCLFVTTDPIMPYENALGEILRHPDLQTFPRIVLNWRYYQPSWDQGPTLLLVDDTGEYTASYKYINHLFQCIDVKTRSMMLVDSSREGAYGRTANLLGSQGLFNVVMMSMTEKRVLYYDMYHYKYTDMKYPPTVDDLYKYQFRDMDGDEFVVTMKNIPLGIYGTWNDPTGAAVRWIQETVQYMNGSFLFLRHRCTLHASQWRKCYVNILVEEKIELSLDALILDETTLQNHGRYLDLSIPHSMAILIPQPTLIDREQIFENVFQLQTHIFAITLLMLAEVAFYCTTQGSILDLTLYVLHGQPPSKLLNIKAWKVVAFLTVALIISALMSLFGAKLFSLTYLRPVHHDITSMEDLLSSNMHFKANLLQYQDLLTDPRFESRILHNDIEEFEMDGKYAYILDMEFAELLMALRINYDFKNGRTRYRRLNSTPFNVNVQFRYVKKRLVHLDQIRRCERIFFESGIWHYWNDEHHRMVNGLIRKGKLSWERVQPERFVERSLAREDLRHGWFVLGIGLTLGVIQFLFEMLLYYWL
uniref:ionotropic receptor 126 precursor n=1 Tax=Aedes aegypti TaxID=7159 RepID=UPI000C288BEB|nr:ionotropic receptor 126 precursor [Aedes aegypti]